MLSVKGWTAVAAGWLIFILSAAAWHYRDTYHHALERQRELVQLSEARLSTINTMQRQQREVAELDARYTRELTHARLENNRLRDDVAAGRRRLRIKGTCKLPETSPSSGILDVNYSGRYASTILAAFQLLLN
ncbi:hypothetical protein BTJ39_13450 [Izhakiella australiensis]|uniref:Uncharacterized protein n=1 Tax=Izhakiella australiensis TaxID=1926881 RepID=A0A1S8YLA2_9GAMM|nr:lysis system i-spanin subunit Rz [Izhakiella australiensis]OON39645.1 hypothetical protein BTJ39_13450 [Izhakiella australiensis]